MKKLYLFFLAALFATSLHAQSSISGNPLQATQSTTNCASLNLNVPFSCQLIATGGVPVSRNPDVYNWTSTGTLPTGLTLSGSGVLSGTPTSSSAFPVTFNASDNAGNQSSITLTLQAATLTGTGPCGVAVCVTAGTGSVNTSATLQLQTIAYFALTPGNLANKVDITALASYSCTAGSGCTGSSISGSGLFTAGTTTGSATAQATFSSVSGTVPVTVVGSGSTPIILFPTSTLPNGQINQPYPDAVTNGNVIGAGVQITASGGTPPYTCTVFAGGPLPSGMVLTNIAGNTGCLISGTPTASGAGVSTTFQVADSAAHSNTVTITSGITVASLSAVSVTLAQSTISPNTNTTATGFGAYSDSTTGANALPNYNGAAFVQKQVAQTCCSGGTPTVTSIATPPMATTTGNMLTVFEAAVPCSTLPVPTDTAGNTYTSTVGLVGSAPCYQMFNAYNITGNAANVTTCNFTTANHSNICLVMEHTGVLAAPLDQHPAAVTASSGGSCIPNSVTAVQANELAIEGCAPASATSFTLPAGFTSRDTSSLNWDVSDSVYTAILSCTSPNCPNTSYSPSGASQTFLATYKANAAAAGSVIWSSGTPSCVMVSPNGTISAQNVNASCTSVITGTVTGATPGTATVTVSVSVVDTGIVITPSAASVANQVSGVCPNGFTCTQQFTATGNNTGQTYNAAWGSSNTNAATVNAASGLATCIGQGNATISAAVSGFATQTASLSCGISQVIDPTRLIDWTTAGVQGGIPSASWTQCGSTIAAGASTATIQAAINSCGPQQFVLLGAGTFNIGGLYLKSNMVLRGGGANTTFIVFNGHVNCFSVYADICMSHDNDFAVSTPQSANWTAGYNKGATQITVTNVGTTGISNGQFIMLGQADATSVGPNFFVCSTNTSSPPCSLEGVPVHQTVGGLTYSQWQNTQVTAGCATTCTGAGPFTLTINPGLYSPNWAASQNPIAWWSYINQGATVFAGVENLSMDATSDQQGSGNGAIIQFYNAYNSWVSGVRSINSGRAHTWINNGAHNTIRNSYFYGTLNATTTSYGSEMDFASNNLLINNVYQRVTTAVIFGNGIGNAIAYNYEIFGFNNSANIFGTYAPNHDAGTAYNLYEGNMGAALSGDAFHGTGGFHTAFRNALFGWEPTFTNSLIAVQMAPYNRYWNVVGNVLGTPGITALYTGTQIFGGISGSAIYTLGLSVNERGVVIPTDSLVQTTLMRWGNYDSVNVANRFVSSEVPSGISPFGNAVPLSQTLPASFLYTATPSWWPAGKPFPPIGPDVTGGNVGQCTSGTFIHAFALSSGECSGGSFVTGVNAGHVNSNPAMDCYFLHMSGTTDGQGAVLAFDPTTCPGFH